MRLFKLLLKFALFPNGTDFERYQLIRLICSYGTRCATLEATSDCQGVL